MNTVFPLISAPGAYLILKVLGAALIRGRRLFEALRLLEEIQYLNERS